MTPRRRERKRQAEGFEKQREDQGRQRRTTQGGPGQGEEVNPGRDRELKDSGIGASFTAGMDGGSLNGPSCGPPAMPDSFSEAAETGTTGPEKRLEFFQD